jgi:hypothetical protein
MSEVKHTPGPHYAVEYAGRISMQSTNFYEQNVDILDADNVGEEEMHANGRLYAAATDLLEALEGFRDYFKFMIKDPEFNEFVKAENAIKKARGL